MTDLSEDAVAFERFLGAPTPAVAGIAEALRATVLEQLPSATESLYDEETMTRFATEVRPLLERA